jgi:hypothetical protein
MGTSKIRSWPGIRRMKNSRADERIRNKTPNPKLSPRIEREKNCEQIGKASNPGNRIPHRAPNQDPSPQTHARRGDQIKNASRKNERSPPRKDMRGTKSRTHPERTSDPRQEEAGGREGQEGRRDPGVLTSVGRLRSGSRVLVTPRRHGLLLVRGLAPPPLRKGRFGEALLRRAV